MYARVFMAQARPGMIDEGVGIFQDAIVPAAQRQPGHRGALLLVDRRTGKFISAGLWETEADVLGSEHTGYFREQFTKISHLIMGAPLREYYEVRVAVGLPGTGATPAQARVTTGTNLPGTLETLKDIFRDNVAPVVQRQPGFAGTLLLTNAETLKSMTISIWETAAAMHATEQSGYYHQQLAKIAHLYTGPGVREHYEVLGQV